MNRTITFRAWNELDSRPEERMVYGVYLNPEGEVCTPEGEYEKWPLMQSTGVKDKNGREIFEGDIVAARTFELAPVEWDTRDAMWRCGHFYLVARMRNNPEVVGNVFENPELLEDAEAEQGQPKLSL